MNTCPRGFYSMQGQHKILIAVIPQNPGPAQLKTCSGRLAWRVSRLCTKTRQRDRSRIGQHRLPQHQPRSPFSALPRACTRLHAVTRRRFHRALFLCCAGSRRQTFSHFRPVASAGGSDASLPVPAGGALVSLSSPRPSPPQGRRGSTPSYRPSRTTGLLKVPIPVISISTVSPCLRFSGAPSVPIHTTSPG